MSFQSFFRRLTNHFWRRNRHGSTIARHRAAWFRPIVESLEKRELLAVVPPVILATGVFPQSGSTTANGTPSIQIQYSDSMEVATAANANNYLLLGAAGNVVPVVSVTNMNPISLGGEPANSIFQLTYNSGNAGNQLVVDNYTLFVKGSNVYESTGALAMANPGQLIVANGGSSKNVSVASLPGTGTIGAMSQYSLPTTGSVPTVVQPQPWTLVTGDINADGVSDLAVVDAGTNQVSIFAGQGPAGGGGYTLNPGIVLNLPTGTANMAEYITLGDFNADGHLGIAVASANVSMISVFINTATSAGSMSFGPATSFLTDYVGGIAAANTPVGLVAADFDLNGNVDLAVALATASSDVGTIFNITNASYSVLLTEATLTANNHGYVVGQTVVISGLTAGFTGYNGTVVITSRTGNTFTYALGADPGGSGLTTGGTVTDNILDYRVNIFAGNGDGTFLSVPSSIRVGDVGDPAVLPVAITPRGLQPSALALGYINSTTRPDLILGGNNLGSPATGNSGLSVLRNTSTNISTGGAFSFTAQSITTASAVISIGVGNLDAGTKQDIVALTTTGSVLTYLNNGGSYTAITPFGVTSTLNSEVAVGDLNADGRADVVVSNGAVAGSTGRVAVYLNGNVSADISVAQAATATRPAIITSIGNGLTAGLQVTIAGAASKEMLNGTWIVTPLSGSIAAAGGIVGDGLTDIAVTTAAAHNLATGTQVNIAGLANFPSAMGKFTITVVDATHFTLDNTDTIVGSDTSGTGTWTSLDMLALSPLSVTSTNATGSTNVTVTVASTTGLTVGDSVRLTNVSTGTPSLVAALNNTTFVITNITATTFDLLGTSAVAAGSTTGGNWSFLSHGGLGIITSANWPTTSSTVTLNVSPDPTTLVSVGSTIKITGLTGALAATLNGNTYTVLSRTTTQITFNVGSANGGATLNDATGGTIALGITSANWPTTSSTVTLDVTMSPTALGMNNGDKITITGLTGALAATLNGNTYTIASRSTTQITFNVGSTNAGATLTDATGAAIVWTSSTNGSAKWTLSGAATATHASGMPVTITTASTAGLLTGESVMISGWSTQPIGSLGLALNGNTYTITVTSPTTFTLTSPSTTGLTTTGSGVVGGTWTVVPTFFAATPNTYNVDQTPMGIALADLDGDSNLDIVTANNSGNDVSTLLGTGNGTFQVPVNTNISNTPGGVAMADLNGDGILDMVVLNNNGTSSSQIAVLQGQVGGTYAAPVNINIGSGLRNLVSLAIGVVKTKASGLADIVFVDQMDRAVGLLLNIGTVGSAITTSSFSPATSTVSTSNNSNPTDVALADFNADGKLDMVVSRQGSGGFGGSNKGTRVFLGNGDGTFQSGTSYENSGGGGRIAMSSVVTGDFNNDGKADFISLEDTSSTNKIYVHYGDGKGGFTNATTFSTGITKATWLSTADFNNDGFIDLVASSNDTSLTTGGVSILLNQLGSGFGTGIQTQVSPGAALGSVIATDLNQDGFQDIVVAAKSVGIFGNISNITTSATTSTITTSGSTGLSVGMTVQLTGLTGGMALALNGQTYAVASIGGFGGTSIVLTTPGLAVGSASNGTWSQPHVRDNVFALMGIGDGTLNPAVPYQMGSLTTTSLPPSFLAVTPSPLIPITIFTSSGNLVQANLIANGNFEARDLNGTVGTLQGWQTYDMPAPNSGSFGSWLPQTGTTSPLSNTAVPQPTSSYRAILDQSDQIPYNSGTNPNAAPSYQGSHALYQDIYIPAGAITASLSMTLYADNSDAATNVGGTGWSDPTGTTPAYSLDFRTTAANQQVRVDILDPNISLGATTDAILGGTTKVAFGKVTGASATAGVVTITTASTAALTDGQSVLITGMTGALATALNGNTYVITVLSGTTFRITQGSTLSGTDNTGTWTQINPTIGSVGLPLGDGVLRTEFITSATTAKNFSITITDSDLTAYAGQTIRLRIASANKNGRLIVGVDNVVLKAKFNDSVKPTLTRVTVQSPAFYSLSGTAAASVAGVGADVTITTTNTTGLVVGSVVQINGLSGPLSSALNFNTYSISNVTGTTFTLDQTAGYSVGSDATGGSWSYLPHTNDSTITGTVGDSSGLAGIAYVAIDPTGMSFTGSSVLKITPSLLDSSGNFSIKLPTVKSGLNTIGVAVYDKAGNVTMQPFQFFMQTNSVTEWQALGPQGIDVSGQPNVNYTTVSGRITSVVSDLSDPSGNSYFVGTPNGGIWKTTNNGASWIPTTNNVTDGFGNPVPVSVGSITQTQLSGYITSIVGSGTSDVAITTTTHTGLATGDKVTLQGVTGVLGVGSGPFTGPINGTFTITMTGANTFTLNNTATAAYIGTDNTGKGRWADNNKYVLYAGTGVGDQEFDSRPGVGVLKSIDGGVTWTLIGNSSTQLLNARIVKIVVDPNDSNIAYAGDSGDQVLGRTSGAVYKTTDGGLTWVNVLVPTAMRDGAGAFLAAGTQLASVTDLAIDPFDSTTLLVGLGNIGRVADSATAGLYHSALNSGATWSLRLGGDGVIPASTLPSGLGVGRVSIGWATGQAANEKVIYVAIATPPGSNTPPSVDWGQTSGLYKTSNYLLNFTKVMLKEDVSVGPGVPVFSNIGLFGRDGANVGSLVVDPNNPNVVYVGGSTRWARAGDAPSHSLIYVDTGNMRDITTGTNDGDDKDKAIKGYFDVYYDTVNSLGLYNGEGVYWYDLNTAESGGNGNLNLLPPAITSLAFDGLGRLLVGTVGGIWRGTNNGMGYDFNSGGTGIKAGGFGFTNFSTPGMSFASLNGNLQIADMTSVALDPNNPGVYFGTQYDTGVSGSTSALAWTSQGLTGPTTVAGNNLNIPTAWSVNASNPPPGSPIGTPVTLFRLWQYADVGALIPETSVDGGTTWTATASNGISAATTGGTFPGFAVNPTPVFSGGVWQTHLLFGTNVVYLSVTSGAVWNQVGPNPLTTGTISAMSFAPSTSGVLYVGTSLGELFYSSNSGGTFTNTATGGLPAGLRINGIAVDPNNANVAFAMLGTTAAGAHVYKTTNAGATWTAVTGPWGNVQTYAMVIDRAPNLAAAGGKIYLATEVGVYYSTDDGANWAELGRGMPRVPVVSLSYSPILQTLAAATLGRGVLTINTAAISVIAPQTIEQDVTSLTSPVIPFTVNDIGLPPGSYTLTATSSNPALIPDDTAHVVLAGSGSDRTIQLIPALHANSTLNGTSTITLKIVDSTGSIFTQTFTVTVSAINYAPEINNSMAPTGVIAKQTTAQGSPLQVNFTVGDVEDAAGGLIVTATSSNQVLVPNVNLTPSGAGSANRTLNIQPAAGTGNATASNGTGGTQVTITTASTAGMFNGQTVSFSGLLSGGGANALTNALNYSTNGNVSFIISNVTLTTFTVTTASLTAFTANDLGGSWTIGNNFGTTTITVNVTDSKGVTTSTSFDLLVTTNAVLPASDNFTRASSPFLGPQWTEKVGNFSTNGTNGTGVAASGLSIATLNGVSQANVALQADISLPALTGVQIAGLAARYQGTGDMNMYYGAIYADGSGQMYATIFRNVNGSWALLASQSLGAVTTASQTLLFEVFNDSLKLFVNGSLKTFANDTALPGTGTSMVGFRATMNSVYDNFAGSAIGQITPSLSPTFTEAFPPSSTSGGATASIVGGLVRITTSSTSGLLAGQTVVITGLTGSLSTALNNKTFTIANLTSTTFTLVGTTGLSGTGASGTWTLASQLSRNWTEHVGNFSVLKNSLLGNSGLDVATLNGVSQADVVVTDSVTVPVGQYAGLVARYSGPGDQNMYLGMIGNAGGGVYVAYIFRNVGGAWVQLSQQTLSGLPAGAQKLRFEVIKDSLKLYVNDTILAGYANDSMLTTGSVGLRSTLGVVWSGSPSFSAGLHSALLTPTISPTFTEDFSTTVNPDHANQLNLNWRENFGNFTVNPTAGVQTLTTNSGTALATLNGVSQADVVVTDSVTVPVGQYAGLVARYSGPGDQNMYLGMVYNAGGGVYVTYIFRNVAGAWTQLSQQTLSGLPAGAQKLRFEVIKDSLKLYVNDTILAGFANDSMLTTGSVGLRSTQGAVWTGLGPNSFTAGLHAALLAPAISPTFSEDFSTLTNPDHTNQLNLNWRENVGNFTVNTTLHTLTTNASLAVATLNGLSQADVVVSSSVALSFGQYGGLVARYSGSGDTNMYWGALSRDAAGNYTAYIFRNVNGTWTQLASTSLGSIAGTIVLRFEVISTNLSLFVNGTLRAFTNDSMLTTGSVGLRSGQGAVWADLSNNFTAGVMTGPASLTSPGYTELFNSSGTFSTNWRQNAGTFTLNTGLQTLTTSASTGLATLYGVNEANVVVSDRATTLNSGQYAGLVARYSGPGDTNMYLGMLYNSGSGYIAYIYRNVAGSRVQLSTKTLTGLPAGAKDLRFEVINDSLKFFVNDTLATAANDSMLTTGSVGLRSTQGVVWSDSTHNFFAIVHDPLTAAGALPFTEDFTTAYSANQLNLKWRENVGAFVVDTATQTLTTSTGTALATLNGVSQADVVVSDSVTVPVGQYAGLVARYSGPGDTNMYLGMVFNSGSGYVATIYRNLGGAWTLLSQQTLTGLPVGAQKLRFEVINDSLKLFVNDNLATATNCTMLTTGSVGVRSTQGVVWTGVGPNSFNVSVRPALIAAGGLPFTEDFTTAHSTNQLNLKWRENVGAFVVNTTTGTQTLTTSTGLALATLNGVSQADVVVSDSVTVPVGQYAGLVARYSGPGDSNMYLGMVYNAGGGTYFATIYRNLSGAWVPLSQQTLTAVPTGAIDLRFEVINDSLKLFVNNAVAAFANDSMLTTGSVGVRSTQGVIWSGVGPNSFNAIVRLPLPAAPSATLPFTDDFSTSNYNGATNTLTTTGNELGSAWKELIGAYSVGSGEATGRGSLNLAVVNTVQTNFTLIADVTLANGQYFGLAARYSGPGDSNMYWGAVGFFNGQYTAYIFKNVGGVWTQLAAQNLGSFAGLIEFSGIGSDLTLTLGGDVLNVTDSSLSSGTSGMRSSAGAKVSFYSAS